MKSNEFPRNWPADAVKRVLDLEHELDSAGSKLERASKFANANAEDVESLQGKVRELEALCSSQALRLDPGAMFEFVKHGDAEHQAWLREAFEAYVAGQPKPEPRGLGRHDALIAELEAKVKEQGCRLSTALEAWKNVKLFIHSSHLDAQQRGMLFDACADLNNAFVVETHQHNFNEDGICWSCGATPTTIANESE